MRFFTTLIPQQQLWHFHWLASIQSMGDLHSYVLQMSHIQTLEDAAPVVEIH
jgi:hypothetical protein